MKKPHPGTSKTRSHAEEIELSLLKLYGVIVGGKDLRHLLGYKTGDAFRQAVKHNRIPFPTFIMEGRRMRMARTHDIAKWLASIDESDCTVSEKLKMPER